MVKIAPLRPYMPARPEIFCTNPYDVIYEEEAAELRKQPESLVHIILPEGEGDEIYANAKKAWENAKVNGIVKRIDQPAIFVYRQESPEFSQEGFILGVALADYMAGNVVKHEHTREKPLKDRTRHISSLNAATGVVWTTFEANAGISAILQEIKKETPKFDFSMKKYRQLLWECTDNILIQKLQGLINDKRLFIADGHHRAASANAYREARLSEGKPAESEDPWQYLMVYAASDDGVQILPYNRIIKKIPMDDKTFIKAIEKEFFVEKAESGFNPAKKHEMAMCLKNQWYKLQVKQVDFADPSDALDVTILQNKVIDPILGIKDIRNDPNISFVGQIDYYRNPELFRSYFIQKRGFELVFNLYPVIMPDIEQIAGMGGVMPPKSTWFEPKLLSGLVINTLDNN